jgi:4-carboxymuconolactone decarboxylase
VRREHQDLLRRLAVNDQDVLDGLLGADLAVSGCPALNGKMVALVRLAALVAQGAASASYQWAVADALAAGASDGEVVGVLLAVAPVVGTVRLESAVPDVALALGHDVEAVGEWG